MPSESTIHIPLWLKSCAALVPAASLPRWRPFPVVFLPPFHSFAESLTRSIISMTLPTNVTACSSPVYPSLERTWHLTIRCPIKVSSSVRYECFVFWKQMWDSKDSWKMGNSKVSLFGLVSQQRILINKHPHVELPHDGIQSSSMFQQLQDFTHETLVPKQRIKYH